MNLSDLERNITPQKISLVPMEPPECVECEKQPDDIGWSCHMYSFGLTKRDFPKKEEWASRFARLSTNFYTFWKLIEKNCISSITNQKTQESNLVLYLNNQTSIKIADMEVLHSAKIDGPHYLSRMSHNYNPEKIFRHEIGSVQEQFSPECEYKRSYTRYVYVVYCKLTHDINFLKRVINDCKFTEVHI